MTPDQLRVRYEAGETIRELADEEGIGREKMRRILAQTGVTFRRPGKRRGRHLRLGREILTDLPTLSGPVTLDSLHEWLGGSKSEIAGAVLRLFRDGDVAIVPASRPALIANPNSNTRRPNSPSSPHRRARPRESSRSPGVTPHERTMTWS